MLGRFEHLKKLEHDKLIKYFNLTRCVLEKNLAIIICEHYEKTLEHLLTESHLSFSMVISVASQILQGIKFLHSQNLNHANLSLENIYVVGSDANQNPTIRLSNYSLDYITKNGTDTEFISTLSQFSMCPERLMRDRHVQGNTSHDKKSFLEELIRQTNIVLEDFVRFGNEDVRQCSISYGMFVLPDSRLVKKISAMSARDVLKPLSLIGKAIESHNYEEQEAGGKFSVVVKEKDVTYQTTRMNQLRHIIHSIEFDSMVEILREQAQIDIPPVLRAEIWRSLLDVTESEESVYFELNVLATHPSDRQLDVDIPRCHQYEELMTSPAAHAGIRKVLKAWLLSNPRYVYWQGCDSISAPFLLLNFNHPATAHACLNKFINRYLYNFFLQDNAAIIQEYLTVFNHLLAYIDPVLYTHLVDLGFVPELYAIPWFLTCFAHVLPMHKLYHIWDKILLHDSSFPLMVGLAVMKELRPRLIASSFNDAILLFSDLPDLSVDVLIENSIIYHSKIPPSCTFRAHASPDHHNSRTRNIPAFLHDNKLTPLTIQELKKFDCPRMSIEEFKWRVHNEKILVIDIRPFTDYSREHVIQSVNCPNVDESSLSQIEEIYMKDQSYQRPVCIMWYNNFQAAVEFASKLVTRGNAGVCIVDVGFTGVRDERNLISVSS
ncbi:unnamed protein product [Caenorhabditis bovis]|uniref:TBC domain-containing protein kinase-like protein n=1 Tax=Caenorhabditis bovis TaxID=2654633 RepID=A0A8S1ELI5_9PELO|nr:unnamed protein product [Caenorhabditis bovis]